MSDELKEARELVRSTNPTAWEKPIGYAVAVELLARNDVAEHMPDDDEPADTSWMLEQWETDEFHDPVTKLPHSEGRLCWNRTAIVAMNLAVVITLLEDPTRGQVRQLCRAVGIELKEDGDE